MVISNTTLLSVVDLIQPVGADPALVLSAILIVLILSADSRLLHVAAVTFSILGLAALREC